MLNPIKILHSSVYPKYYILQNTPAPVGNLDVSIKEQPLLF